MSILRNLLALAAPPSEPPIDARADDCARRSQRKSASSSHCGDAIEATARAQAIIDGAVAAEQAAAEAAKAAAAATRQWAIAGGRGDVHQKLLDEAGDAQRRATQAQLRAAGAKAALPELERIEHQARSALREAEAEIQAADRAVMLAEVERYFAILEEGHAERVEAALQINALARALFGKWQPFGSSDASNELQRRLRSYYPKQFDLRDLHEGDAQLLELSKSWAGFGRRLMDDPGAQRE